MAAAVHGCSIHALDPSGGNKSPSVSIMQSLSLSTLWSTPVKGYKQAVFHARFIEKLVLEVGVVSQQHNGTQHTSPKHWVVDTQGITMHTVRQKGKETLKYMNCTI